MNKLKVMIILRFYRLLNIWTELKFLRYLYYNIRRDQV